MIINGVHLNLIHVDKKGNGFSRLAYSLSCFATWCTPKINIQCLLSFNIVVDIGLMQTAYTTSEAMGLVSVCVEISSAQLARNISVTLRSVDAGQTVGKPFNSFILKLVSAAQTLPTGSSFYDNILACMSCVLTYLDTIVGLHLNSK